MDISTAHSITEHLYGLWRVEKARQMIAFDKADHLKAIEAVDAIRQYHLTYLDSLFINS